MTLFSQFLLVAGTHCLALLSPGPDFFLIVRNALRHGARQASGACFGIALANALYIGLALAGVVLLHRNELLFTLLKWAGGLYLGWLGLCFLRAPLAPRETIEAVGEEISKTWWHSFFMGLFSGLLNPKNSLFYASLFSLAIAPGTPRGIQLGYGVWMFSAVLVWDLVVAWAAGHPRVVRLFVSHIGKLERLTGAILLVLAVLALLWAGPR